MKIYINWSGGKDSSLALYKLMKEGQYEIDCLLTTISGEFDRISMHGVRTSLLEQQAKSIGLPLIKMMMPEMPSMEAYNAAMKLQMEELLARGNTHCMFGDIFLEDLRRYRDDKLAEVGVKGVYPLWKIDTKVLVKEFLDLGFKTVVACVDDQYLDKSFAGRVIDEQFLADLPDNVDPCGENGEFHTFVFDGPIFKEPIKYTLGEKVFRQYKAPKKQDDDCFKDKMDTPPPKDHGFWYCDLIPEKA